MPDHRLEQLQTWLVPYFDERPYTLNALAGDASFRRYFRIHQGKQSYIAMDAPPEQEDCRPFVALAQALAQHHVQVPEILKADLSQGFLLLNDFGDRLLLQELNTARADALYSLAIDELLKIQTCQQVLDWPLPAFDAAFMTQECDRFLKWYCQALFDLSLSDSEQTTIKRAIDWIIHEVQQQPKVCVHRDYHSRNLLLTSDETVAVLDFQDAVYGPLTYDIASLLRDCYIDWPLQQVQHWALQYRDRAVASGICDPVDDQQFLYWFDMTSLQRHLKCVGIFARLCVRDNKPHYLNDVPRVMAYIQNIASQYAPLQAFANLLQQAVPLPTALSQ